MSIKILADAALPAVAAAFPPPFEITYYDSEQPLLSVPKLDVLLCRSTLKVTPQLLKHQTIQCVATATSGIDHIDQAYLAQHNIRLFDAKGSNAIAVADYMTACLALLMQQGMRFKQAGVIGLGAVGQLVVARLKNMGLNVIGYDPFQESVSQVAIADLLTCDLICIHANYHTSTPFPSHHLLDEAFLNKLKPGTVIINAARGDIVNEQALLACHQRLFYCTDVYSQEPHINAAIIQHAFLCTPHIAGHSVEGKIRAVYQLSQALHQHYQLSPPTLELPFNQYPLPHCNHWQEIILSLYNPLVETQQLQTAVDKKTSFLSLRTAHHRHEFNQYNASGYDELTQLLLGQACDNQRTALLAK